MIEKAGLPVRCSGPGLGQCGGKGLLEAAHGCAQLIWRNQPYEEVAMIRHKDMPSDGNAASNLPPTEFQQALIDLRVAKDGIPVKCAKRDKPNGLGVLLESRNPRGASRMLIHDTNIDQVKTLGKRICWLAVRRAAVTSSMRIVVG